MPHRDLWKVDGTGGPYWLLTLTALVIGLLYWRRHVARDSRLGMIFAGALAGAFLGAKMLFLLAEGWAWMDRPERWQAWLSGKTILGALLGGFCAVELVKRLVKYTAATGDHFATIVPASVLLGRIGCWTYGCCGGIALTRWGHPEWRWPSVPLEMAFQAGCLIVFAFLRKEKALPGQHFHLYLVGYGVFRFLNEFGRTAPVISAIGLTGYQLIALGTVAIGSAAFAVRAGCVGREVRVRSGATS